MKKLIIVANWKCNPTTLKEAKVFFHSLKSQLEKSVNILKNVKVVICPPFVYLPYFQKLALKSTIFFLGAQDCFWEEKGAFTGEISPLMLKDLACQYVILGHSERRQLLNETNEMIGKKLEAVLRAKLKPILCIGETAKERKKGVTFKVLKEQLKKTLRNFSIPKSFSLEIIFAYEPVWAIGTGKPCQPKEAKEVLLFLKKFLKKGKILYGGSVNSKNAPDYIKIGFDGLLVGSASLIAKEFVQIVKNAVFSLKKF